MVVLFLIVLRRDGISLKKNSQTSQLTDFLSYAVDKSQYFQQIQKQRLFKLIVKLIPQISFPCKSAHTRSDVFEKHKFPLDIARSQPNPWGHDYEFPEAALFRSVLPPSSQGSSIRHLSTASVRIKGLKQVASLQ